MLLHLHQFAGDLADSDGRNQQDAKQYQGRGDPDAGAAEDARQHREVEGDGILTTLHGLFLSGG